MSEGTTNQMNLDDVVERFENHISGEDNSYIILSGKYGIGKTYFLHQFFDDMAEKYHPIFISPLKYAINSSENIFELIKLDIALEMYQADFWEEKEKVKDFEINKLASTPGKKTLRYFKHFLKAVSKVHPLLGVASAAADGVTALIEEGSEHAKDHDEIMNLTDPDVQLSMYMAKKLAEQGHFAEMDIVTESIGAIMDRARKEDEKEWVLVIDDFDRIDPEHIFRILNVLSAHQTEGNNGFKFGFDKVVIVCDYGQIERLYLHKYGAGSNFRGYIDKFHSKDPFYFEHSDRVALFLERHIDFEFSEGVKELLLTIVSELYAQGIITMRNIDRAKGFKGLCLNKNLGELSIGELSRHFSVDRTPAIQIIPLLNQIFGDYQLFKSVLQNFKHFSETTAIVQIPEHIHELVKLHSIVHEKVNFVIHRKIHAILVSSQASKEIVKNDFIFRHPESQKFTWEYDLLSKISISQGLRTLKEIVQKLEESGFIQQLIPGAKRG